MFCYQCEQTNQGTGCTKFGVCGKDPHVAALLDLLIYVTKGISMYAHLARKLGKVDDDINRFTIEALFTTVTNVNFDTDRYEKLLKEANDIRNKAKALYEETCKLKGIKPEKIESPADFKIEENSESIMKQGEDVTILKRKESLGDDITGLQELLTYGLKGISAYADHARILGKEDDRIYSFIHESLAYLAGEKQEVGKLLEFCMKCGEINLLTIEILDNANTSSYGHPEPTQVRITPKKGKSILISGHDLKDLEELLKQTEGKGINIYTHGEMLPANAYPSLKKYKHLVGNYGGAWQEQRKEFNEFPGAILMTTNCIQKPKDSYKNRIFTTGLVAWPQVVHIKDKDFTPVIKAALEAEGFKEDAEEKRIWIGFGHNTVMSVADKVIEAVKNGAIKHFFLIGGCDGAKPGRNYYTEFAQKVPKDCIILTLACGKYRFNKLEYGDIGGIPRLLDMGQCNDAYSAILVAVALSKAFNTDVNNLPLSLILSWYEQKAVAILLTLLHLGIKNMRLGPSLPAFVTPAILKVLVEKFNIKPITTPEEDLRTILG
ncbi:MAG: hydroxylamine reductase [Candidatus Coatesbacteria bacterium]|nr:hydroxylamine reductase [Candidatus Coatesbacteria bacterium]